MVIACLCGNGKLDGLRDALPILRIDYVFSIV